MDLFDIFLAKALGGGTVTPQALVDAAEDMSATQKTDFRDYIGAGKKMNRSTVTGATPSVNAQDEYFYKCGELTSLTVTQVSANSQYTIRFTSGSTPTTLVMPEGVNMPDGFTSPEANTLYEISVLDGEAVVYSRAVSVGE